MSNLAEVSISKYDYIIVRTKCQPGWLNPPHWL